MHGIHDTEPAARWEDAFLSGNGEFGLMVFGDPHHERIVHNHHRYVLPNESLGMQAPAVADRVEHVRDLILAGKREQAQREFSDGRAMAWTQSFHPGHVLHIDTPHPGPSPGAGTGTGPVRDYRRDTDFRTGEVTVRWSEPAGPRLRRAFVSRADRVAVIEITGPDLDLDIQLSGETPGCPASITFTSSAVMPAADEAALAVVGRYPDGPGPAGFIGVTLLIATGGQVAVDGAAAQIRGSQRLLLLTRMDRTAIAPDPTPLLDELEDLPTDYATLLTRHTAIHTPLYESASLDLAVADADRCLPVADLLARARTDVLDPVLVEAMFHSGRYLLLSSTGVLPPRLTGLWLGAWDAAWAGDFTTDANLNLQLAGAVITGMPELLAAHRDLIAGQIDDWRTNARTVYGARGILAPSRTDGEHGTLFHLDDEWPWQMWVAGADWLLYPLCEYWAATGDDAFLADTLTPWLREAALFFEDFLTLEDADGHVVLVPSYSPEIGPKDVRGVAGINAAMDLAAARHALTTAAAAHTYLGIEPDAVGRWHALAAKLPPYRVDGSGALAEWAWPGLETAEEHRHISHLHAVWPFHQITPDDTPELAVAARAALLARGDENMSAHGSLHRALCAARLKDADTTRANLLKILGRNMVFRSLMTSHNPDLEIYNADAAHCLPGVLAEMLVDSRPGLIEVLPALPEEWGDGRVRGIRTRTRATVEELEWDLDAGTVRVALRSAVEQAVTVVCRTARKAEDRRRRVVLPAGPKAELTFELDR